MNAFLDALRDHMPEEPAQAAQLLVRGLTLLAGEADAEVCRTLHDALLGFTARMCRPGLPTDAASGLPQVLLQRAEAALPGVMQLRGQAAAARFIAHPENNLLEAALTEAAYRAGDTGAAHWLADNEFYGWMQTELFRVIYRHDREKAAHLARRLRPGCVAWLLKETCETPKQGENGLSPEICFVFAHLPAETAHQVWGCLGGPRQLRKQHWGAWRRQYETLMQRYFPTDEAK